MKYFIFVMLAFSMNVYSSDFNEHWKNLRRSEDSGLWKSMHVKGVYASITISKNTADFDVRELKDKKFLKKLMDTKKEKMPLISVTDWKVSKHYWKGSTLVTEGTYKDLSGDKIQFKEVHVYLQKETKQVLFVKPYNSKKSYNSDVFLENFGVRL